MAEELEDICLACGKKAFKRTRTPASSVCFLLDRYLCQRCEEADANIDVAKVISCNWVCRACARSYKSHEDKDKRLYDGTAGFVHLSRSSLR